MANDKMPRKHDPDVQRDFETGTVNPGPGMAPPHRADDIPAGSMTGASESGQAGSTSKDRPNPTGETKPGSSGD